MLFHLLGLKGITLTKLFVRPDSENFEIPYAKRDFLGFPII